MITVVIPVLNEENTIGSVVQFALADPIVSKVIVVDDASTDGTAEAAMTAGAQVIQSTLLGKGVSMHDGVVSTQADCIVFLDGDLHGLQPGFIGRLAQPVIDGEADFVKAAFSRTGGRVTELTVKPLLQVFFPELSDIAQPIGGIVAASRQLLMKLDFEPDYGVDVGLLIDSKLQGARIAQVDIGGIEHDSQSIESLGRMARQVIRTIFERARTYGRLDPEILQEMREAERHVYAGLAQQSSSHNDPRPIVLLSVNSIVLEGDLLKQMALHVGRPEALVRMEQLDSHDPEQLQMKAGLFSGLTRKQIEMTARLFPLQDGIIETVKELRRLGYRVAVIGDFLHSAVEILRRRVYAHLSFAHVAKRSGIDARSGELVLSPEYRHMSGCQLHEICHGNVVNHLIEHYGLEREQITAVGTWQDDACLLRMAGRKLRAGTTYWRWMWGN